MKKKQLLSLILACAMLVLVFAGCGNSAPASAAQAASAPAEGAEGAAEPAAATDQADAPAAEAASAAASAEEGAAEEAGEPSPYTGSTVKGLSYPVGDPDDPAEFTIFMSWVSMFEEYLDSWNDLPRLDTVTEATGVKIVFHEVSSASASEQFNLMIASGDMTDIIQAADYYVGGLGAAYSDEIIYDLTDMVEENCPIYYDMLMNHWNQASRDVALTSGRFLSINTLKDEIVSDMGLVVRGDWMDELGMEVPETFGEFKDLLYAMHDKYNCSQTLYVGNTAEVVYIDGIYGVPIAKISGGTDISPYLKDGEVASGIVADEYRDWLVEFHQLYKDGIIGQDFYVNESSDSERISMISSNATGAFRIGAESMHLISQYTEDENSYATPIPKLVMNKGDKYLMGNETAACDNKGFSITTSCDDPELVLQYFDWFFTDEGVLLTNYGEEGLTYEFDENGVPRYTDLITNNPDGKIMMVAVITETFSQLPMLNIVSKMWAGYTAEEEAAIHLWSDQSNDDFSRSYPSGASLTSDETLSISNEMTAVISYSSEEILKFMTGAMEINDANWQNFVDNVYAQGLQACLDVYNNAYQEFLSGDRVASSGGGGDPGAGGPPPGGDGPAPDGPPPA